MTYHPLIHDLDLCVLSYQVYNQTLVWPLDPWYERWSRVGSSRRDNMLAAVHELVKGRAELRGPGSTRAGWPSNPRLDPIVTDYSSIRPVRPSISRDGINYRLFATPPSIASAISDAVVCEYASMPAADGAPGTGAPFLSDPIPNADRAPGAADRLFAFEGGTGGIEGFPAAWSLLGIVLERDLGEGEYAVHIAFRGSQSGSAYRAAYEGFIEEGGNPDWVTDLEVFKMTDDDRFSRAGSVVRGFRDSAASSLSSLVRCLQAIHASRGRAPTSVRVTGHSLGGALATQFAAAMTVGSHVDHLDAGLASWPWRDLTLTTFSSPKVGDGAFAASFDREVSATRVWADGDPLVTFPTNAHVGEPIELHSGLSGTVNHEPSVIRRHLIAWLRERGDDLGDTPERPGDEPWRAFATLAATLEAAEESGWSPRDLVSPGFAKAMTDFVDLAARIVGTKSSYTVPITKTARELRRRSSRVERAFSDPADTLGELRSRMADFAGIQPGSEIEDHLREQLIMREASVNDWSTSDLLADPVLADVLGAEGEPGWRDTDLTNAASPDDIRKIKALVAMRRRNFHTVNEGSVAHFRQRRMPTSGMPRLVRASEQYPDLPWIPRELMVPDRVPAEARLPKRYVASYYGVGKLVWNNYGRAPLRADVRWDPGFGWNEAFPPTGDGWERPTSDETFTRLRLQGPNPWVLRRAAADHLGLPTYEADFTDLLRGVLPPIVARFVDGVAGLTPLDISVGAEVHRPGDPTWDRAKQMVNAADARHITFGLHLLDTHLIVGQAFALAAYRLPTWHRLRPFMQFFTYGTLAVNDIAFQALLRPSSYFLTSGFVDADAVSHVFANGIARFDLDRWIPPRDIAARGLAEIADHPYASDAALVWPAFVDVVDRHLGDIGLDEPAIAADQDLQDWHATLISLLPNTDPGDGLDRARLVDLCTALLWNNVAHEVCGDLSPILGSEDPADKAIINLDRLRAAWNDGRLLGPVGPPTMADVFLMDQASYVSRFNVGGNNMLAVNAARFVDDPKLRDAIIDLQTTLTGLQDELVSRNQHRAVRFARMLPQNWEASISF